MITIDSRGHIFIDGNDTFTGVYQTPSRTIVYQHERLDVGVPYAELKMPQQRYALTSPGEMAEFEADIGGLVHCVQSWNES